MGCELYANIVYVELSMVLKKQREVLKKLIEKRQEELSAVYPGLTCFKDGIRQIPIESIPGVREAGYRSTLDDYKLYEDNSTDSTEHLYTHLRGILNQIKVLSTYRSTLFSTVSLFSVRKKSFILIIDYLVGLRLGY